MTSINVLKNLTIAGM